MGMIIEIFYSTHRMMMGLMMENWQTMAKVWIFAPDCSYYMRGAENTSDQQAAYLCGGVIVSDSCPAFFHGYVPHKGSHTPAFIPGDGDVSSRIRQYPSMKIINCGTAILKDKVIPFSHWWGWGENGAPYYKLTIPEGTIGIVRMIHWYIIFNGLPYYYDDGYAVATPDLCTGWDVAFFGDSPAPDVIKDPDQGPGAYARGKETDSDNTPTYINGIIRSDKHTWLQGEDTGAVSGSSPGNLSTRGLDSGNDSQSCYLTGSINDSQSAHTHGIYTLTNSAHAYTTTNEGGAGETSAFLRGKSFISPLNRPSGFLHGNASDFNTREIYTHGKRLDDDDKTAYLCGIERSDVPIYLYGILGPHSSSYAYAHGVEQNLLSGKHGYLYGVERSSVHACIPHDIIDYPIHVEGASESGPYSYIILETTDEPATLSKKFKVLKQDYDDGTKERSETVHKTLGGGTDFSVGEVRTSWSMIIRVKETETETGFGDRDDLEYFFSLNDPGVTPNNAIDFIDHRGNTHEVYMLGSMTKNLVTIAVEGTEALYFYRITLLGKE